ncbi:hypothetical protein EVAR_52224_1 [Eumeta japonica]|uniref:Uncharacterized protein n=1 Tax=Eumeta variegata TaxID=151549 RepID=A0A4C1Z396_EUMVA|nr:hypothetical protein EVAR_52224_1 [Eumeta japonica]
MHGKKLFDPRRRARNKIKHEIFVGSKTGRDQRVRGPPPVLNNKARTPLYRLPRDRSSCKSDAHTRPETTFSRIVFPSARRCRAVFLIIMKYSLAARESVCFSLGALTAR